MKEQKLNKQELIDIEYALREKLYEMTDNIQEINDKCIELVDESKIPDEYYQMLEEEAMEQIYDIENYTKILKKVREMM